MRTILISTLLALAANSAELKATQTLKANFKDGPKPTAFDVDDT